MKEKTRHGIGIALAAAAVVLNYSLLRQTDSSDRGAIAAICAETAEGAAVETGLNASSRYLIPGGQAVGVALKTQGVLVVAKSDSKKTDLRVGDVILAVDGMGIDSAKALAEQVDRADSSSVELSVLRAGRKMNVEAASPVDHMDGRRRLGVWVRDSTAGVGTLSYVDPISRAYGALGHAIVDADTGSMLDAKEGAIMSARVIGVVRGQSGSAGELRGSFLKENEQIGSLKINSEYGIYGCVDGPAQSRLYPQGLPVGSREEVHIGPATILSTVDESGTQEYDIEIIRCFDQNKPDQKGMILRVTDQRLMEKTGGIVQGMSGSPILQDGKIIGAVTHVYLSDPARGYGMYIEWMLEKSDRLQAEGKPAA